MLFEAIGDPTLGQIIGSHLNGHTVACQHTNSILAHPARRVGNDFMIIDQLHAEGGVWQKFDNFAFKFEEFFFGQNQSLIRRCPVQPVLRALYRAFHANRKGKYIRIAVIACW